MELNLEEKTALVCKCGTADRHNREDTDTDKWLQMYQIDLLPPARRAQGLVVYVCSSLAGSINGQNIRIDWGAISYV